MRKAFMLDGLLTNYPEEIESLMSGWLANGAECVALCSFGVPIKVWPETAVCIYPSYRAPIVCRGLTLGELVLYGELDAHVDSLLQANADLLARLILSDGEMASLAAEVVQNQAQLIALYELFQATRLLTDVHSIVNAVAASVSQLLQVEAAFVWLQLPQRQTACIQTPERFKSAAISPLVEWVLEKERRLLIHSRRTNLPLADEIENILLLPMRIHQNTTAVLGLVNKQDGPFELSFIKLLNTIIKHAETQIEKAILYEKTIQQTQTQTRLQTEMDLARSVQMNLLPSKQPTVQGLEIKGAARPALSVGGDYYDFFEQRNGDLYFTLGDVSGKGMPAAMMMAMTRSTMRNIARFWPEKSPEMILTHANGALYDDFTEVGMFVTLFVGQWSPTYKTLTFANAGHSPVIYRPRAGQATIVEATGVPIGVLPESMVKNNQISFDKGDLLVVATDGFNETCNPNGEMFDYERLLTLVDELAMESADTIVASLYTAVATFGQGEAQDDDQTIIVIKGV